MKKVILTGDRPTGKLHLGHYVGSLANRIKLQDYYDCYFIIADYQFLTDNADKTKQIQKNIQEIVLDYLSVGINPKKAHIFIESQVPEIAQIDLIFSMITTLSRVKRNPTIKEQIQTLKLKQPSLGYVSWPVTQAADILSVRADVVPVGKDQVPHVELTREIASKFNRMYKKVFPVPSALVGQTPTLPGLDGKKMSKSRGNAVYLSDSEKEVEKKIMTAITDPEKIKIDDIGHPEICNIYQYYKAFFPKRAGEIKKECQKGKIGCVACKKELAKELNEFLKPIRAKRKQFEKKPGLIEQILKKGREDTQKRAKKTLDLMKKGMGIHYFMK